MTDLESLTQSTRNDLEYHPEPSTCYMKHCDTVNRDIDGKCRLAFLLIYFRFFALVITFIVLPFERTRNIKGSHVNGQEKEVKQKERRTAKRLRLWTA